MLRVCDTAISYSTTKPKICRSSHSYPINSFHLYISIQILLNVLSTFPKVLTGRMCLTIGSFLNWWSFPLFSWPLHLIQGWCCKEKLEANPTKMLRGLKKGDSIETVQSYLLIVIPNSIVINNESHEEKRRHYCIEDNFPWRNLEKKLSINKWVSERSRLFRLRSILSMKKK